VSSYASDGKLVETALSHPKAGRVALSGTASAQLRPLQTTTSRLADTEEEGWGPPQRKRLETDAAERALFLHTRNCLCSLTARSCKWKINNSMSSRRRNNATLHQTGPCFTVSLESIPHERTALPFGLYILLMWMHIYGAMD